MMFNLTYKPYGEQALLIEWPQKIDETILQDILLFKVKINNRYTSEILSLNHTYASLIIVFAHENINFNSEVEALMLLYKSSINKISSTKTLWNIPVCYEADFGIDLKIISEEKNITVDTIIQLHSKPLYTVYFVGFLPGFLYLGGLNKTLFMPRKETPRLKVKKGAVAIGGEQTGVYPSESPGGWQIIGNSPINFFDVKKSDPCFAKPGDVLKFQPVSFKEHSDIKTLVDAGVYQLESEVVYD